MVISSPEGRILPGRMLREMVTNIETKYQIYEYSMVKGRQAAEQMDDLVGMVPLAGVGQRYIVFQRLHPSFAEETAIKLTPEEVDAFRAALDPDEEFVMADYTISIPKDYFVLVTDDVRKFITVTTHLKLDSMESMQDAVARLGEAAISIYDEADMLIEYMDENFPEVLFRSGLDETWLGTPMQVTSIHEAGEGKKAKGKKR